MDAFDVKKQLVIYGSHHNNKINILIHLIFVPTLFWTGLVVGAKTGPLIPVEYLPAFFHSLPSWSTNLSFATVLLYSIYYAVLDSTAAIIYAPILLTMAYTATQYQMTTPGAIRNAIIIHIISWLFQFAGHGFAEKRSPKLVDNFIQAIVLAPFFVLFEILFFIGYRPQLHKEMREAVGKNIAEFRKLKASAARANKTA
ncbi:hypothetical protein BDF14DRAFT_1842683 [Spinellus fusiger]|nr:hypothetical protein BDF14DRAFT_1842683 [Spinellus fusiger]